MTGNQVTTSDYSMLINGELLDADTSIDVVNPATGKVLSTAPDCTKEQLDYAVQSARSAFKQWKNTSASERSALLCKASAIIKQHADKLALLLTQEQGKSLNEALFEIQGSAAWVEAVSTLEIPVTVNVDDESRLSETHHVPLGVVAGISPWNFPVLLSFWKIAPALAAGNCLILKPSPFTPLTMLKIAALLRDVFPPGVLNIISGGDALGPTLTAHEGINKISFTGSTETGKRVMRSASGRLARVTLELGGNDAAVVLPGANLERAATPLAWGAFRNTGQVCINAKRIYVHEADYDVFVKHFVAAVQALTVGPADTGADLGPVQNERQYRRVLDLLADCSQNGYEVLTGGEVDEAQDGYFIPLTVIGNPPKDSRIVQEEPFGPIVPVLKYTDIDSLIDDINDSEFALAGSVWGEDLELAQSLARQMETGTVWINEIQQLSPFEAFAGHKQSGLGVENGLDGLLEYTVPKTLTINKQAYSN